jgi:hypothetical protein
MPIGGHTISAIHQQHRHGTMDFELLARVAWNLVNNPLLIYIIDFQISDAILPFSPSQIVYQYPLFPYRFT